MSGRKFTTRATLQSGALAVGPGTPMDVTGLSHVGLQVTIAGVATVGFEASLDGNEWYALEVTLVSDGSTDTTATATGTYNAAVAGLALVRAKIVNWTSGAVDVTALGTTAAQ